MKKIDVEKSTIYTSDNTSVSLCIQDCNLGRRGYFSNDFVDGNFVDDYYLYTATLDQVRVKKYCNSYFDGHAWFKCFIPEGKLVFIEEPKKYRPFKTIDEFSNETGCEVLGEDFITIRNKNTKKVYVLLFVGYSDEEVHLGGYVLTFADLLKNYEFLIDEWQPFGIEE